jgi:hypothetical protein
MTKSRLIITVDLEIPDRQPSSSTYELLAIEQKNQIRGMIFRGLKRTVKAFNCLQEQENIVDHRVFNLHMDFSDISFAIEHKIDGNWNRSSVAFGKTSIGDGYEVHH